MEVNFIYPGQGSQYIGLGKKLFKKFDYAKKIINSSNEILEYNIIDILDKNPKLINQTKYTQPIILIYSLISDYIVKEAGYIPISYAGHSLGEYTALVASNCISFECALKIVKKRSESMDEEGKLKPGKMCAVLNLDKNLFNTFKNNNNGIITVANYNSNKQTIISGDKSTIDNFIIYSKKNKIKTIPLNVSGAFHSPLMKNVTIKLEKIINSTKFSDVKIPVYQNAEPNKILSGKKIKSNLKKQVVSPVYWVDTINKMYKNHTNIFLEVGPGNVLSKLNKNINRNINSINSNLL